MSEPREELREAIARAILTPDESYYSDESLFDTDRVERELALHRADCVLRTIVRHPHLVLAALVESGWRPSDDDLRAMGGKPGWHDRSNRCWRFPEEQATCEDGGESPVFVSARPMSPTMRQAVAEAKQRPPARHFEPSTLLEDGERTTCATCDDSGMVTISGRPEDGPDPCPDCWPEDGERS